VKPAVSLCAAFVVGGLVVFWFLGQRRSEADELRQRIAVLEREAIDAKMVRAAPATSGTAGSPVDMTRPAGTPPSVTPSVAASELSASEQTLLDELNVRRFQRTAARQYGEAMNRLSLDSATRQKVLTLFAKAMQAQADTGYAARKAGITDPAVIRERAILEVARSDAETREALGPELFEALQWESWVSQERTTTVHSFSIEVAAIGAPLTSQQSDALARVIAENKIASQRGALGTAEDADTDLFEKAAKVLSPAQFDFFRRSRLEDAQLAALNRKLNARK
jgi:hypothetical protein